MLISLKIYLRLTMKNLPKYILLIGCIFCFSCNFNQSYKPATDALDAAREFVGACVVGDFEKANAYMVQNDTNKQLLMQVKKRFKLYTKEEKKQLAESSLQNITIEEVTTTETIIHFKNSFVNTSQKLKVVFINNNWLVDYQFTFNPNL